MDIDKYSKPAVVVHWLMAILIILMIIMGMYMSDLPKGSEERSWFFALHKSIGLTLALLVVFRTAWKVAVSPPALPSVVSIKQRKLAMATHHILYLLMFLQPISGYLSSSFSGYKTKFWGIPLYNWGWKDPELNELFSEIHDISAYGLILFISIHLAGVAYHIHKKEHQLIKRMWF